jgi:DNA-nicking Smr family endonuclease
MARKNDKNGSLTPEDQILWDLMMRDVTPLKDQPKDSALQSSLKTTAQIKPSKTPPVKATMPKPVKPQAGSAEVDRRTGQKLKRGQLAIEGRLDLHGMTQAQAHESLRRFIKGAYSRGLRCLLVITGKGRMSVDGEGHHERAPGVIRRSLPLWLEMDDLRPLILKTENAHAKDGGGGAFYILLRRQRSADE